MVECSPATRATRGRFPANACITKHNILQNLRMLPLYTNSMPNHVLWAYVGLQEFRKQRVCSLYISNMLCCWQMVFNIFSDDDQITLALHTRACLGKFACKTSNCAARVVRMLFRPCVYLRNGSMVNVTHKFGMLTGNSSAVERRTVDATAKQQSLGRWFKSALPDTFNWHAAQVRSACNSSEYNVFTDTVHLSV